MAQFNITLNEEHLKGLFLSDGQDEAFSKLLEEIFNQVLLAQSTEQLGAKPYERTEELPTVMGLRKRADHQGRETHFEGTKAS